MYRKVLAIINEINDKTMKPKAAQVTLDEIAQEALKSGDIKTKELADRCFAMMPLVGHGGNDLEGELEDLAFLLARPISENLEKRLCERFNYNFDNIELLREQGTFITAFTPNGNLYVELKDNYIPDIEFFDTRAIAFLKPCEDGTEIKIIRVESWKNIREITAMETAIDIMLA